MARKLTGIRRKGSGWQAYVNVAGARYLKQFALETPIAVMQAWRKGQQAVRAPQRPLAGSFAEDVDRYLAKPEVAAMASLDERRRHLQLWLYALGASRARASITRDEIETVLQGWLRTLAEPTVYHRRTALQSLYAVLDGAEAPNPVRATTRPSPYQPVDRSISPAIIARILDAMPDWQFPSRGMRVASLAKVRATVIAATGIPPAELMKLTAADVDLATASIRMPRRRKGKGADARILPLSPEGVAAFQAFHQAQAYGPFAAERLSVCFKRAARRVLGAHTEVRLYDLRHSLGADLYRTTRDLATVGRLLGHAPGSAITARYAMGAHADVDRAAVAALSAARQAMLPPVAPVVTPTPRKPRPLRIVKPRRTA